MKKLIFILIIQVCLMPALLYAQPKWAGKATKSVFTLKTFKQDGSLLASGNGFFIGNEGEAVSNFSPFVGASRAGGVYHRRQRSLRCGPFPSER